MLNFDQTVIVIPEPYASQIREAIRKSRAEHQEAIEKANPGVVWFEPPVLIRSEDVVTQTYHSIRRNLIKLKVNT